MVLDGGQPLRGALRACLWPRRSPLVTVVSAAQQRDEGPGFCQARSRRDPAEGDLIWLAPSLSAATGAVRHWSRLAGAMAQALGARGTQRIYVVLPRDDTVALGVFQQAGFAAYTDDTVYRRPWGAPDGNVPAAVVVDEAAEHQAPIHHSLAAGQDSAPAAGGQHPDWETYPLGGWLPAGTRRRVWLGRRGEVRGAWRWLPGRAGHWLRPVAATDADPGTLLRLALAEAPQTHLRPGPVYVAARGGDGPLQAALVREGFEPIQDRRRLVKHTTARLMQPAWQRRRLPEPATEVSVAQGAPLGRMLPATESEPPTRSTP